MPAGAVEQPLTVDDWLAREGAGWIPRGDDRQPLAPVRVRRLLGDPEVRVLHFYDGVIEVAPADRDEFWQRVRPYLEGKADRESGDHTDFWPMEFKNARRESLLIIRETC